MIRGRLLALLALLFAVTSCQETDGSAVAPADDGTGLSADYERDRLTFVTGNDKAIEFDVYVARTVEQQRRGLMFVRELPQTTGMLFVYDRPSIRSIWMKNTFIPLDLIFVRADGRVSSVVENVTPLTEASRSSKEAVKYIVELNGGVAAQHGIDGRSRMIWGDSDDKQ